MNQNIKTVISVEEFAHQYGISRTAAYQLAKSAGFPSARLGKRVIIPVEALERWIANGGTAQREA